jgi:pyroglutamyl-peptidase
VTRTVLVTGFAPFGGRPVNASWEAVARLAQEWRGPERLVAERLPVDFEAAPAALARLVAAIDPDLVVCVGEAGGRSHVAVERVALNLVDARIPDNAGLAPVDVPVVPGAPTAHLATIPVKACAEAVRAGGVPAVVSHTAGTFVCNATFYALLHLLGPASRVRAGFVHVPTTLEPARDRREARSDDDRLAGALAAVVRTALDVPEDLVASGGTLH